MRALREFGFVIVAGFVAFFSGLLMIGAALILWSLGLVSALMLMVSVFAGVMYLITGETHDAHIAIVYLGYAAAPFAASFVLHVYRGKFMDSRQQRRPRAQHMKLEPRRESPADPWSDRDRTHWNG
jgi:hypothetical protein